MDFSGKTNSGVNAQIREIGEKCHTHRAEIYHVVRMLNNFGVNLNLIAASLNLQKWKTFYGDDKWSREDVKEVVEACRTGKR
jgi:hypothetical protein